MKEVETIWVLKRLPKEYVQSGEPWVELRIGEEIGASERYGGAPGIRVALKQEDIKGQKEIVVKRLNDTERYN